MLAKEDSNLVFKQDTDLIPPLSSHNFSDYPRRAEVEIRDKCQVPQVRCRDVEFANSVQVESDLGKISRLLPLCTLSRLQGDDGFETLSARAVRQDRYMFDGK